MNFAGHVIPLKVFLLNSEFNAFIILKGTVGSVSFLKHTCWSHLQCLCIINAFGGIDILKTAAVHFPFKLYESM